MLRDIQAIKSQASYVEKGYGQVEPNHLSAQRTGQIYAQLPTASAIEILENGQFVKYDYANNQVNFTGAGEWMLVLNEIKLYRDFQKDCEFAMVKGNYLHEVYSPYDDSETTREQPYQSRFYGATGLNQDAEGNDYIIKDTDLVADQFNGRKGRITTAADPYELDSTDNPFAMLTGYKAKKMADRHAMVPRVLKTNVGDIFTTNTINEKELEAGDELVVGDDGILTKTAGNNAGTMKWQVVKVYTMPDGQKGVKIMRIA